MMQKQEKVNLTIPQIASKTYTMFIQVQNQIPDYHFQFLEKGSGCL